MSSIIQMTGPSFLLVQETREGNEGKIIASSGFGIMTDEEFKSLTLIQH